jgi:PAS domain S-box-containing protein
VNEPALGKLGESLATFLAKNLRDLAADPDRVALDLAGPASPRLVVWRLLRATGGPFEAELALTPIEHEGRRAWLVQLLRDVTADGLARAALIEARLAHLLAATQAVAFTATTGVGVTFVSKSVEAVLGYTPEQCQSEEEFWSARIHPDDKERVMREMTKLWETGQHAHEYRMLHADGKYRWLRDELFVERHGDGGPSELIGCFMDITARREAEQALRRAEANFRTLIEDLPVAVLVHRDNAIRYANPALVKLLGYGAASEIVGRSPLELVPPAYRELVRGRIGDFVATGMSKSPSYQESMLRKDGTVAEVELEAMQLDFDGAVSTVVMAHDLSERREILARLAASDRLASVGTLAASVAHEINNPLAFVLSNLTILKRELPILLADPERARFRPSDLDQLLCDAHEGASRIGSLVRDLRSLSHPDQQGLSAIDVHEVFASCLRMVEPELRNRARVTFVPGDLPLVEGNPSRLGQVFLNLLVNAAHAIPEGRPNEHEIRITTYPAASPDVVIEVADTGSGIPAEILGHIFDPFFTTKAVGVGTGLGLAISRSIIQGLGGQMSVESEPGRGATFRIILPISAGVVSSRAPRGVSPSMGRRLRILVIDDERAIGDSLRLLLGDHHEIVTTTRARMGLELVQRGENFDVILCDLMMPEMSGVEFFEALTRDAPSLLGRLVFITGGAFTPSGREFLERVPNPRLEKPFDVPRLYKLVEEVGSR